MINAESKPFKASHPGSLINDELKARGLKRKDFAVEIGLDAAMLNEIIKGKRPVTAGLALSLEKTWGISAGFWLRYQLRYDELIQSCKIS